MEPNFPLPDTLHPSNFENHNFLGPMDFNNRAKADPGLGLGRAKQKIGPACFFFIGIMEIVGMIVLQLKFIK